MDASGTQGGHVTGNGGASPEEECIKIPKEQEREAGDVTCRAKLASTEDHQLTEGKDLLLKGCPSCKCPAFRAPSEHCDGWRSRSAKEFDGTDVNARRGCVTGCEVEMGGGGINHQRTAQTTTTTTTTGSDGKMQKWSKQFRKKACIIKLDGCHYTIGTLSIN